MIVISDTSAITNLAAVRQLQLLLQLYDQVTISEAVYRELAIDPSVPGALDVQAVPWLEIRQVVNRNCVERLQKEGRLDPGESEAIALALELNASAALYSQILKMVDED